MAMTFRDIKGSKLTNAEADANFRTLVTATGKTAILAQLGIAGFDVNTSSHIITITLLNGEAFELGPFGSP